MTPPREPPSGARAVRNQVTKRAGVFGSGALAGTGDDRSQFQREHQGEHRLGRVGQRL